MNDIIKLILLNVIIIYFFYKDKKISIFLMSILLVYYLYLKNNKIEGNSNLEEKKKEARYLNMLNIDRLLDNLIGVYEKSEQDCIGEYSEFTPCDKKCGKTYKYQTYRVIEPGGPLGTRCLQEDGDRKKVLCDKEDNIYPCEIGGPCDEDADCITDSCDPETDRCVSNRVCSHENLDLCNRIQCLDLNNQYDYHDKEFKFGSDLECKLENILEEDDEGDIDIVTEPIIEVLPDFRECPWYMEQDYSKSSRGEKACKMKNINTEYLKDGDGSLDLRKSQYNKQDLEEGLYCKIGYKYNNDNDVIGVIEKIEEGNLDNICNESISNNIDECEGRGYWPPLSFFIYDKNALITNESERIPIDDMCKRCNNTYIYERDGVCAFCGDSEYEDERNEPENQFYIGDILLNKNNGEIGKNVNCYSELNERSNYSTCGQWKSGGGFCRSSIGLSTQDETQCILEDCSNICCLNKCPQGKERIIKGENESCDRCDDDDVEDCLSECCTPCSADNNEYRSENMNQCEPCRGYTNYIYRDNDGNPAECVNCPNGYISNSDKSTCILPLYTGDRLNNYWMPDTISGLRSSRGEVAISVCNLSSVAWDYTTALEGNRWCNRWCFPDPSAAPNALRDVSIDQLIVTELAFGSGATPTSARNAAVEACPLCCEQVR